MKDFLSLSLSTPPLSPAQIVEKKKKFQKIFIIQNDDLPHYLWYLEAGMYTIEIVK